MTNPATVPLADSRKPAILIVDDAPDNLGTLRTVLLRHLDTCLRNDDARAEDALTTLQNKLPAGAPPAAHAALAAVRQAVEDIEYDAALSPLAELARALDIELREKV